MCSDKPMQALTHTNQLFFINFGYSSDYKDLEIFYDVIMALTEVSPDYALYVMVQGNLIC